MKRVVIAADYHCGHIAGLTPPAWQMSAERVRKAHLPRHVHTTQERLYNAYRAALKSLQPIHCFVLNGDAIEGKGERSGGTELITSDRGEQIKIAAYLVKVACAARNVLVYGTAYHTGGQEDWESILADKETGFEASIGSHEWLDVNGLVFDIKHHIGGSSVPHGRGTALARDRLWNLLWAERGLQPRANVIIRAHVHYHAYIGEKNWVAMTCPALQAAATKYGARRCSGTVDVGLLVFDVVDKENWTWRYIELAEAEHRAKATRI